MLDVVKHADRNVMQKETENKIQGFMYRDTTNLQIEMYDYTANNWSHRNSNKRFKEKFGSHNRKTYSRFTTKDSSTRHFTHDTESIAV
jgi:hypothetical protein